MGALGVIMESSWSPLKPSWCLLGISWGALAALWAALGSSWDGLGSSRVGLGVVWDPLLAGLGRVLGVSWGIQNLSTNRIATEKNGSSITTVVVSELDRTQPDLDGVSKTNLSSALSK